MIWVQKKREKKNGYVMFKIILYFEWVWAILSLVETNQNPEKWSEIEASPSFSINIQIQPVFKPWEIGVSNQKTSINSLSWKNKEEKDSFFSFQKIWKIWNIVD